MALADDRDTATAYSDDHAATLEAVADGEQLHNLLRFWRGYHPPVAALGVFDDAPIQLARSPLGLFASVKGANRLSRLGKSRIGGVNHYLRHHRHHRMRKLLATQHVAQYLLKQIAYAPLGFRATEIERQGRNLCGS